MAGNKLLLAISAATMVGIVVILAVGAPARADEIKCSDFASRIGACPAPQVSGTVNGGGVDLSAGFDRSSGGGGQEAAAAGGSGAGASSGPVRGGTANPGSGASASPGPPLTFTRDGFSVSCPLCEPGVVVHVSDLANFPAAVPSVSMEPEGWALKGLPANFVAGASVHERSGMLLGFMADVRFSPARFRWDFGDGGHAETSGGGASWAALRVPEFSATPTSHVFTATGRRAVTVSVVYTAQFRIGSGPWRAVEGTLTLGAAPLTVVVAEVSTVLVPADCLADPTGIGC
jgi:hypothetical protein